jgi:type I restriction enzyme R subunit
MSQIIPYTDPDLEMEKLYTFVRFLLLKLQKRSPVPTYHFDEEAALKYYRLQKISDNVILELHGECDIEGSTSVVTGIVRDEKKELSQLIEILNKHLGIDFKTSDQLFFDSIKEDAVADEELKQVAKANTMENFGYVFKKALQNLFIDRMEQNEEITTKFMMI